MQAARLAARSARSHAPCVDPADTGNIAVQRDDVPAPEIEAVVADAVRTRVGPEVLEIRHRSRSLVLVIAGNRARSALVPPPRPVVTVAVRFGGPGCVRIVAKREDCAGDGIQQARGIRLASVARTQRDIAGSDEYFWCELLDDRK